MIDRISSPTLSKKKKARTIAKQFAKKVEAATANALTTKAGCECVAHIVQVLTDQDANATVVTVDGLGRTI